MWPFLYETHDFAVPTYLVINSLAFCVGVFWLYKRAGHRGYNQNDVLDIALAVMIGSFIGARGFHILFEHPRFYWDHPGLIWKFWYGGFVFYGGALGATLAAFVTCRLRGLDFLRHADLFAPVIALGYAIGRVGCLAAGCCYGTFTTMPWGITFPAGSDALAGLEAPGGIKLHPTQIYASLWELANLGVLLMIERQGKLKSSGQVFGLWLILHGFGRGLIEQFRGDFRGPEPFNLSISTWLSGVAIIAGVWLLATAPGTASAKAKN